MPRLGLNEEVVHRVRVSARDVHYGGGLVDGAWILGLFGDVGTEILIRYDGDEGLLVAYKSVELLAPIHAGDVIEASGKLVRAGNTSRETEYEARKVITQVGIPEQASAADFLLEPVVVARAVMVSVVPKSHQRLNE
jgi:3-aminobutyryl-CoA ammonia-lyase